MDENKLPSFRFLPLTIGIETVGGISTPLVLRGSPLPATRADTFSTAEDNQKAVTIRLTMGERPFAGDNLELAKVDLNDIPPYPRGEPQVEVTVTVDRNCKLTIAAIEKQSGNQLNITTEQPEIALDENAIQRLIDEAEESREADQNALRKIELKNKANGLLSKAEAQLRSTGSSRGQNAKALEQAVAELGLAIQSDDPDQIRMTSSKVESVLLPSSDIFNDVFGDIFSQRGGPFGSASKTRSKPQSVPKKRNPSKSGEVSQAPTSLSGKARIFGTEEFTLDPSLCFVLMPFEDTLQPVYDDHIRKVVEGESFVCVRADDIVGTQQITFDIWEHINRARFLVADLTKKNPNVFYELGLAHALGKQVILLTQSVDDVPFDLKTLRCLAYEYTPRGIQALEQKLRRTIRELVNA